MGQATTQPEWWTPLELGNRWRVSASTVTRMLKRGDVVAKKIGDQWRIHITAIESYEADGMPKPTPTKKPDMRAFDQVTQYV